MLGNLFTDKQEIRNARDMLVRMDAKKIIKGVIEQRRSFKCRRHVDSLIYNHNGKVVISATHNS